ncbi:MAG: tyrosine-type recombinase/integrase [Pseudomonadota bacterium]
MRKIFRQFYAHFGDEDRINPFRNLSFKEVNVQSVFPIDDDWVRERILEPSALEGIHGDAWYALFALIETGCRICEIANLGKDDIVLDTGTPYFRIRPKQRRELKTLHTMREIPLVGIALESMKRFPSGFPNYRDRSDRLSGYLNAALRERELLPTSHHKLSSFRHSFEKRMLEAGIDYGLRCDLMGHVNERPKYGDGGSMTFRRDQFQKIAHPFDQKLFVSPLADTR